MNQIEKIIIEGIRKIPSLSVQDAYDIVRQVQQARDQEIKESVLREYGCGHYRPVPVYQIRTAYGCANVEPTPAKMDHSEHAVYGLFGDCSSVVLTVRQGEDRQRVIGILKHYVRSLSRMPDDEWSKRMTDAAAWAKPQDDSDAIPF